MSEASDARVLVVDDERRVAETYRIRLRDEYDVDIATSGEAALEMIDREYDVVLLDRRMPKVSGDEVLEEIRRRDVDSQVVMVTAVDPEVDIIEMQCVDYLVKPVERDELKETIERALQLAEYSERRRELGAKKLKRNVLEVEMHEHELESNEKYSELTADIDRLEAEVDDLEDDLGVENVDRFI